MKYLEDYPKKKKPWGDETQLQESLLANFNEALFKYTSIKDLNTAQHIQTHPLHMYSIYLLASTQLKTITPHEAKRYKTKNHLSYLLVQVAASQVDCYTIAVQSIGEAETSKKQKNELRLISETGARAVVNGCFWFP